MQKILSPELMSSELALVKLPHTGSEIVRRNNYDTYCFIYRGLKGLFRKDIEETKKFGRRVCDWVREMAGNGGFFTSDELPRYGISPGDLELIWQKTGADRRCDLVVVFAYGREESEKTKQTLQKLLEQERHSFLDG